MGDVVLDDVSRIHDDGTVALSHVSLTAHAGEILALVGPSGAGKSTLLRVIAGLEPIATGSISINGRPVDGLRPAERDVALTAEHSVFPHLTAEDNLRFPLEVRRVDEQEMSDRVGAEARVLHLGDVLGRKPPTMSAGEQQRLAVGKATIRVPSAFLLDEPLHHLDAAERARVGADLALLLRGFEAPTIIVTHDIRQAMAFGDRLAVLDHGVLHHVGTAPELYARPATTVVAVTVGDPGMALVPAWLDGRAWLVVGGLRFPFPAAGGDALRPYDGQTVVVGVRPDDASISGPGEGTLPARVERAEHLGATVLVRVRLDANAADIVVRASRWSKYQRGDAVHVGIDVTRLSVFDRDSGVALWHGA